MKRHWNSVAAAIALMLGVAAMSGMVVTDEYAHAASAEARGYQALFNLSRPSTAMTNGGV
jgi:hypothetical protein